MTDTVNDTVRKGIAEAGDFERVNTILCDLFFGRTNPELAAEALIKYASQASSMEEILLKSSNQVLDLACDHAFLQPQLVKLVAALNGEPPSKCPNEVLQAFRTSFGLSFHDMARATYGGLRTLEQQNDESSVRYYVNLNGFTARLMVEEDASRKNDPSSTFTRPDDALFIISSALEAPLSSPEASLDVDIPAAAQYMIHAAAVFLRECESVSREAEGAETSRGDSRGKLWTGKPGFSRERWELWKKQFNSVQSASVLSSTEAIADAAFRAMLAVEN